MIAKPTKCCDIWVTTKGCPFLTYTEHLSTIVCPTLWFPWPIASNAEVKPLCSAYQKIILLPRPDYASRYCKYDFIRVESGWFVGAWSKTVGREKGRKGNVDDGEKGEKNEKGREGKEREGKVNGKAKEKEIVWKEWSISGNRQHWSLLNHCLELIQFTELSRHCVKTPNV